jgi:hypothetical protein
MQLPASISLALIPAPMAVALLVVQISQAV